MFDRMKYPSINQHFNDIIINYNSSSKNTNVDDNFPRFLRKNNRKNLIITFRKTLYKNRHKFFVEREYIFIYTVEIIIIRK